MNKLIDHTLLKAYATDNDIKKLCDEAIKYNFKSVCVNPANIKYAKECLKNSDILVCTVIGFPLGANTIEVKEFETKNAVSLGADEIDMVINVGKAKMHDYDYIYDEIKHVVDAAKTTVKVILETCYLTQDEIINTSNMAKKANATFVKTSTGFGSGGAKIEDIILMKKSGLKVKASGGIRTKEDFDAFVKAGASRIGTSQGVEIVGGKK